MHSTARTLNMKMYKSKVFCDLKYVYSDSFDLINRTNLPTSTHNTKFYIEAAFNVSLDKCEVKMCGTSLYGGAFWLS